MANEILKDESTSCRATDKQTCLRENRCIESKSADVARKCGQFAVFHCANYGRSALPFLRRFVAAHGHFKLACGLPVGIV